MVGGNIVDIIGTVTNLAVNTVKYTGTTTNTGILIGLASTASTERIFISNINMYTCRCLLQTATGSIAGKIFATNISAKGGNRLANVGSNMVLMLNNFSGETLTNAAFYVSGGATLLLYGSSIERVGAWNGFQRAGSEIIRCLNMDFPADTGLLTPAAGDKCFATAGAVTGPAVYTGTAWKSLYSLP
jgi:hypothetical protein